MTTLISGHPALQLAIGLLVAWLLDLAVGDPRWLPHPVMLIAAVARTWERITCRSPLSALAAGRVTVAATLISVVALTLAFLLAPAMLFPPWPQIGGVVLVSLSLACRGLGAHGLQVASALDGRTRKDLFLARRRVGWMVSRETGAMDRQDIARACVESVAENMSDGVVAPLLAAVLGGLLALATGKGDLVLAGAALGAMVYKTVNTMDSLFGYRSEKYLSFGRAAARLDDRVNWVPARISGWLLVLAARMHGLDSSSAWRIMRRDAPGHQSPNGGWPEAAMAGALGIRLGGPGIYDGRRIEKPTLGDDTHLPAIHHIHQAVALVRTGCWLGLLIFEFFLIMIPFFVR